MGLAATLVGCPPAQTGTTQGDAVRVVPGELDAKKLLAAPATEARAAGAGPLTAVGARIVTEGEQLGSFVEVPSGDCLLVLARGGKSVSDIDLFVYSDGGDRLASDEAPDARAAVLVCPPHPRRVYVVARSVSGEGIVALGVMPVPTAKAEPVSKAVGVRGRPGEDTGKLAQWPGLERAIRERRASLGSRWEDARRVAVPLSPNAHTAVSAQVDAGRCIDVFIVPSDEVQGVDAFVVDDAGRTIARGKPPGKERGFVVCAPPQAPQTVTVRVRPRISSGLAAVIIGRSEPGAALELARSTIVASSVPLLPLAEAVVRHEARTETLRLAKANAVADGALRVGDISTVPLDVAAGCTRIDVIGGAPLGRFALELWGQDDQRIGKAVGGETATTFVCGAARKARLEVIALDRAGPFAVRTRRDQKPGALLGKHPVAASRLLARLDAAAGPIDVEDANSARALVLAPNARASEVVDLGARGCTDIVVAAGASMSDLSLTVDPLRRPTTESDGLTATHQRICVGGGRNTATVRVEAKRGSGTALLLLRRAPDAPR